MDKLLKAVPHETTSDTNEIRQYIRALVKHGASDMHLKADRPPQFRIQGKLVVAKVPALSNDQIRRMMTSVMESRLQKKFEEELQCDFSFNLGEYGRFRANVYMQQGTVAAAIRAIPRAVQTLEALGVPLAMRELATRSAGLILITGSTGSGKSTTQSALIEYINRTQHCNIITIEDPIEYIHTDGKSSISQREVGTDAISLNEALRGALRQDPDVIVVGEMRDAETIATALTAAETGHLVISTLHTIDAKASVDRILDVFPAGSKEQVRIQLSESLVAVLSQKLLRKADKSGRTAACELLVNSPTIANYIRKNEIDKIHEIMAASNTIYGMCTFNQTLEKMVESGTITTEEAISASPSPQDLKMRLDGFKKEEGF